MSVGANHPTHPSKMDFFFLNKTINAVIKLTFDILLHFV